MMYPFSRSKKWIASTGYEKSQWIDLSTSTVEDVQGTVYKTWMDSERINKRYIQNHSEYNAYNQYYDQSGREIERFGDVNDGYCKGVVTLYNLIVNRRFTYYTFQINKSPISFDKIIEMNKILVSDFENVYLITDGKIENKIKKPAISGGWNFYGLPIKNYSPSVNYVLNYNEDT